MEYRNYAVWDAAYGREAKYSQIFAAHTPEAAAEQLAEEQFDEEAFDGCDYYVCDIETREVVKVRVDVETSPDFYGTKITE